MLELQKLTLSTTTKYFMEQSTTTVAHSSSRFRTVIGSTHLWLHAHFQFIDSNGRLVGEVVRGGWCAASLGGSARRCDCRFTDIGTGYYYYAARIKMFGEVATPRRRPGSGGAYNTSSEISSRRRGHFVTAAASTPTRQEVERHTQGRSNENLFSTRRTTYCEGKCE
jgi:hypothetical protein